MTWPPASRACVRFRVILPNTISSSPRIEPAQMPHASIFWVRPFLPVVSAPPRTISPPSRKYACLRRSLNFAGRSIIPPTDDSYPKSCPRACFPYFVLSHDKEILIRSNFANLSLYPNITFSDWSAAIDGFHQLPLCCKASFTGLGASLEPE